MAVRRMWVDDALPGQTETSLELPAGTHTLQLVLGDAKHYPFDPPVVSDKITVRVRQPVPTRSR